MENNTTPLEEDGAVDSGATLPEATFDSLTNTLKQACQRVGWADIMPVQKRAIPYVLAGRDVMVQARTGSGKTGAFVLPMLQHLDAQANFCQALILVPTRELARQVAQEARNLSGPDGIRVVEVYGGVGYGQQNEAFRTGAQLVVGTPGRILDHLNRGNLSLDKLQLLVFDEADRMLSVGFYPDMKQVQRYLPKKLFGAFMFSATFPHTVLRLADEFLTDPEMLSLSGDHVHIADIEHVVCQVPAMGKERVLIRWIEMDNPSSAIIFSNTKRNVEFTAAVLRNFGYDAQELSSDLTQNKREQVLNSIREGKLRFLVATDVAARGIDIHELSHVFLLEPPEDPESYIHRAGRTGRAGASGKVITLVDVIQKAEMNRIAHRFEIEFLFRDAPTDKDVAEVVEGRLTVILEARRRALSEAHLKRLEAYVPLARAMAGDVAARMTPAMLLDEVYQASLQDTPTVEAPSPDREIRDFDPETLKTLLEEKRKKLKPIERERVARYLRLAEELTGDDESCVLLAMLMDEAYQSAPSQKTRPAETRPAETRPATARPAKARAKAPEAEMPAAEMTEVHEPEAVMPEEGQDAPAPKKKRSRSRKKPRPEQTPESAPEGAPEGAAEATVDAAPEPGADTPAEEPTTQSQRPERPERPAREERRPRERQPREPRPAPERAELEDREPDRAAPAPRAQRPPKHDRIREEKRVAAMLREQLDGLAAESRERVARFVPLAKRMAGDGESWELLAMLLDQAGRGETSAVEPTFTFDEDTEPRRESAPRESRPARRPAQRTSEPEPIDDEPGIMPLTPEAPDPDADYESEPIMRPKSRRPRRRRRHRPA